jgi:aryl-alcohol dehydrogenase-like predicted oxidoreductase
VGAGADHSRARRCRARVGRRCAASGSTATQTALRFCLFYAEISTVIPGMLNLAEVENAEATRLGPLPAAAVEAVRALNRTDAFFVRGRDMIESDRSCEGISPNRDRTVMI